MTDNARDETLASKASLNAIVSAKIDRMTAAKVRQWLGERKDNCRRHALKYDTVVRDGWLDDEAFFAAAIGLIDWTEAGKEQ